MKIDPVLTAVASATALAILGWIVAQSRDRLDRRRVRTWLRANTRDEPGESHTTTEVVAKGTGLPEDRVRRACMSDHRIHRLDVKPEHWSVWRKDPRSVYETRGIINLGDDQ
jgi:hypothetical protein